MGAPSWLRRRTKALVARFREGKCHAVLLIPSLRLAMSSLAFLGSSVESNTPADVFRSCVSSKDMADFIRLATGQCAGDNSWAAGYKGTDVAGDAHYTVFALANADETGAVYVP